MNEPIMVFLTLLSAGINNHIPAQGRHLSLIEVARRAETYFKQQNVTHSDYYLVEISTDRSRSAGKGEEWYRVWAKTDSVVPRFAAVAMSSNGYMREMEPPAVMQALAEKQSRPKLSLVDALKLGETYAKRLGGSDRLQAGYLITLEGGSQHWHILSKYLSLFVFMDATVQETGDL